MSIESARRKVAAVALVAKEKLGVPGGQLLSDNWRFSHSGNDLRLALIAAFEAGYAQAQRDQVADEMGEGYESPNLCCVRCGCVPAHCICEARNR